jgi:hypothetical protein
MGQTIKVQRPVSSASISGLYVILEAHLQYLFWGYYCTSIGYSTVETKEAARIGYNGFLFPHEYSGEGRGAIFKNLQFILE